jgi:hypothetical protein
MRAYVFYFHCAGVPMYQFVVTALTLLSTVALSSLPVAAQVELNPSHPTTYTVQSGDTLWGIAGRFLQDPWRWSQVWDANRGIGNPDLIYPGDVLQLYYRDGEPRVGRRGGMRTVRLSPRVRVVPLKEPIPTIPIGAILPFLTRPYVLDKAQIKQAPYIVAFPDEHVVVGAGDLAYVRSIDGPAGESYDIVRPGEAYVDPDSGAILGYEGRFIAEAVLERAGDPAKIKIEKMELETGVGDRVFSSKKDKPQTNFFPQPAPEGVQGRIISVLDGVSQIGQYDVVVLNVGSGNGVRPGHVFDVFNGGERVRDVGKNDPFRRDWKRQRFWSEDTWYDPYVSDGWIPDSAPEEPDIPLHIRLRKRSGTIVLPYEKAGTLMVFRSFDHLSFALIMRAMHSMFLLDAIRPPPA